MFSTSFISNGPHSPLGHIYHISWRLLKIGSPAVRFGRTTTSRLFSSLNHCSSFFVSKWIWVYSLLNSPPSDQTQSASNGGDQKTHRLLLVFPLKSFIRGPVQDWTTYEWLYIRLPPKTLSNYPLKLFYSLNAITFKS